MTPTAALVADDPLWLILLKVVVIFGFLVVMALLMIWMERRVLGRMQHRPGPNRVGPFGLLQSLADGLKLAFKEDIQPVLADPWVYMLAPVISTVTAFTAFAVIPLGGPVSIFGHQTVLQVADLPVGVLVVLACSSLGVYGIVLAGWSSGSPYPLLGSLRSAAQVISYEIALGLSIVAVILYAGSLSTADIVAAQSRQWWFVFLLFPSFAVFVVSMVAETNRAPFDLPEAESELVGGFHTEYSSLKFGLFVLAEYVNMVTVSALATTLFLGGWHAPWPLAGGPLDRGWWGLLWFISKLVVFVFVFIWLRATLPRLRYDQFMALGWKVLVARQPGLDRAGLGRSGAAQRCRNANRDPSNCWDCVRPAAHRRFLAGPKRFGTARRRTAHWPGAPRRLGLPVAAAGFGGAASAASACCSGCCDVV